MGHITRDYRTSPTERGPARRPQSTVLDLYDWSSPPAEVRRDDVVDLIRILRDLTGGRERYASQPPEIKAICLGLRRDLILHRFPTMHRLRRHLETFTWETARR
jgi:hypothetical protein